MSRWLIQICCAPEASRNRADGILKVERGLSVLAFVALADLAAEQMRHQLLAVADAEDSRAGDEVGGSTVGLPSS